MLIFHSACSIETVLCIIYLIIFGCKTSCITINNKCIFKKIIASALQRKIAPPSPPRAEEDGEEEGGEEDFKGPRTPGVSGKSSSTCDLFYSFDLMHLLLSYRLSFNWFKYENC